MAVGGAAVGGTVGGISTVGSVTCGNVPVSGVVWMTGGWLGAPQAASSNISSDRPATDSRAEAEWVAAKIAGLRVFEDDAGKMNLSLSNVGGELLVISQFTLYGDVRKGRRPSFTDAAAPDHAEPLVDLFIELLREAGFTVASGVFGAHMAVEIHNDGPVTLLIEK